MKRRNLACGVTVIAAALTVTACGGGSSSSSTTTNGSDASALVKQAQAAVTQAQAPVTKYDLGSSSPKVARNKLIYAVTCTNQGDGCPISAQGVADATKQFGWKVRIVDGRGDPGVWNSAILNAISSHADGIVLSAVAPGLVKDALAKATAAHIPVVSIFEPIDKQDGLYGHVTPDHAKQGAAMADWAIADSGGKAHVVIVADNEFVELGQRVSAFEQELAKCSGCSVEATVPSTLASLSTRTPGAVASALQQHPTTNYVVAVTDNHAVFAAEGIQQSGRSASVKLAGFDGNTPAYGAIRKGGQAVTIAEPFNMQGWLAADLLIHAFAGDTPQDRIVPDRMLTKDNITPGLWNTEYSYQSAMTKLWSSGK